MDFSEKWGRDIEEATNLALADLEIDIEDANVIVIEEPTRGFLGFGSKLAKVRVEKKEIVEKKETITEGIKPREAKEKIEPERKKTKEPIVANVFVKSENATPVEESEALDFLRNMIEKMGLSLDVTASQDDEGMYFNISGKESGTVIGKRGQTLDAIQYLTSLVVNKETDKYIRVIVDAENYRQKREKTLVQLAKRLADKVVRTGRTIRLEPMNPYERKVIHTALQKHSKVFTASEGDEPSRRVVISKK